MFEAGYEDSSMTRIPPLDAPSEPREPSCDDEDDIEPWDAEALDKKPVEVRVKMEPTSPSSVGRLNTESSIDEVEPSVLLHRCMS